MTTPDMGVASGKVRIEYESTGAAKVTQELQNVKQQVQSSAGGFTSAASSFNNLGQVGRNVTGQLSNQVSGLATTFMTLGRSGTSGVGAVTSALSTLGRTGGSAMRQLTQSISGGGGQVVGAAGKVGSMAGGAMSAGLTLGIGATVAAATVAVAGVGTVLAAGLKRLVALDEAKTKLQALGYSGEETKGIMEDVKEAVLGTAYSLDEAATAAGQALAAGVKPGEQLTGYLKNVASAAAVANKDFNEMAHIFNRITSSGKVMGYEIRQLEFAGLAPVSMLAKQLGKSEAQIRDMVSKGQITAKIWNETVTGQMGNAADIMGKSITGSIRNMKAAIGRMGENILAPLFEGSDQKIAPIPNLINKASAAIDSLGKTIGAWMTQNKDAIMGMFKTMQTVAGWIMRIWGGQLKVVFAALTTIWKAAWEAGKVLFEGLGNIIQKFSGDANRALDEYGNKTQSIADLIRSWGPTIAKIFAVMAAIALESISRILKGLSMFAEFLGHTAPIILNWAEVTIAAMEQVGKAAGFVGNIVEKIGGPIGMLVGKQLKGIEKGSQGARQGLDSVRDAVGKIHGAAPAMGEMSKDVLGLSRELKDFDFAAAFAKTSSDKLAEAQRRGGAAAEEVGEAQQDLAKILEELGLSMEDLQAGIQGTDKEYDKLLKTLEKKGAPPKLISFVKDMRKEFKEADQSASKIADAIAKIGDQSETSAGKAETLLQVMRDLQAIPGDLDEAWSKYNETLAKSVEYTDDWVDSLWNVGPALIKQNGLLNTQNKNAQEAEKRVKDVRQGMYDVIAKGGDVETAYAQAEAHIKEILSRVEIRGPEAQAIVEKYLGPRRTLEVVTSVKDGDKTKAELAAIIALNDKAQREGKDKFETQVKVEGDPADLQAVAERYGAVWKNYNELTGYVTIEIPNVRDFAARRQEMTAALAAQGPLPVPVKPTVPEAPGQIPGMAEAAGADIPAPTVEPPTVDLQPAEDQIKAFGDSVPGLFKPAVDNARDAGKSMMLSFAEGIVSGTNSVRQAVLQVVEMAAGALPGSPAKYGPLSGSGFTGTRGKNFTSAFAQGIAANVSQVKASAVSVAYGAAQPMTDRFDQFIQDLGELSSFGRKVADFMQSMVDVGLNLGKTFITIGQQFGIIPKQYKAAAKEMSLEQAQRLQRAQALAGQPQVQIERGPGVSVTANAGNVEVSTAGTTVPLVQNPDGTWTSPDPEWAKLIKRESTGRANVLQEIEDVNKGANRAQGLFQITPETWRGAGGERFAAVPNMATPQQQAAIAAEIFGRRGGQPWGSGAGQNFGRENEAALRAGLIKPAQQAGDSLVRVSQQANSSANALKGASVTYNKAWTEAQGLTPLYTPGEYAYGAGGMPQWATDMAKQFGLQVSSSISASGATSLHGAGFAFDFSGSTENMERMAKWLRDTEEIRSNTMQLIFQGAGGARYGVAGGQALTGAEYYGAGTYGSHADHIHWATTVAPILANANSQAMGMPNAIESLPSAFAGTGAAPGPARRPGPLAAPGPRPGPLLDDATQSVIDLGNAAKTSTPKISDMGSSAASTTVALGQAQVDLSKPGLAAEENLQPATVAINRAITQMFGPQGITDIGGYRANDPYPFHPGGRALDVMINNWQDSGQKELGDSINSWLIQNAQQLGLEATIWRQQYYGIENGFKASAMEDRGSATQNHMDHVHLQTKVGAVGLDAAGAMSLMGVPVTGGTVGVNQFPDQDSRNLSSMQSSLLGIPDIIRSQADSDENLAEAIRVSRSGQAVDQGKAIKLTQHMDGLIAQQADQTGDQSKFLGQIRDGIMARGGIEEAPPGGGMFDQISSMAGGISGIINDVFEVFDATLKTIASTKDTADMLVRGIANTEDIMKIIDTFQTYLELAQKITQTAGDIAGFASQFTGGMDFGGTAAAAAALQGIAAIIGLINTGVELAQEAYRIGTKYMGRMLTAWLGLPGANDVAYLLDTLTGQLQAYTTENPELKQTFNTLGRQLGGTYGDRIGAQNQFNIYQGPGQDPRDTMSDAMFAVRSSGSGAFGYAGQ